VKMTLQVTLNSGVKVTKSREVKTFMDVGMFGRSITDWVGQIKKIAPDLATDMVDEARIVIGESDTPARPARKRNRSRKPAPVAVGDMRTEMAQGVEQG
jgi:hypothetical protein